METTRIGLIGCGKQAPKHISGLRRVPGVELVLADRDPQAAERLAGQEGLPWERDVDAIFRAPDIQAVDICTPTPSHVELIGKAVETGKDFFCEKPLCATTQEARAVDELVRRSGRIGMVGYVYRFSPVFERAQRLFRDVPRSGESVELGRIVTAFFRLGGRGSHQLWKHRRATGGGAVNEMLVHMVDLAVWFFGPVRSAELLMEQLLRPRRQIQGREEAVDAEDYVMVRFETESGVQVLCQADLVTPAFTQFVEVQGENGTFMGSIQPEVPSYLFLERAVAGYPAGKTPIEHVQHNLFEAQMAVFVRAVRSQAQPEQCTLTNSLRLMEAMDLMPRRSE